MKWIKRGLIFNPEVHGLSMDCQEFAQSPQTLVLDNVVRIYFSTRKRDSNGKYLSQVVFIDMAKDFSHIVGFSQLPVFEQAELGTFDEHGIFPINILRYKEKLMAYTCGWSRRISVPVETSTGLAFSNDGGLTFTRYGKGPILTSSLNEPCLVGDSFVQHYNGEFHMWYIFGREWFLDTSNKEEPPARVYKIAHATSPDGISWTKEEGKPIIPDVLGLTECQALPTVRYFHGNYHMFFCYRHATDFRTNHTRGYRIGYAKSKDLKSWSRDDSEGGIGLSESGWDSEMMCYPHVFEVDSTVYLLYNGNEFGKYGFGLAELKK